jgi:hypothetical protein
MTRSGDRADSLQLLGIPLVLILYLSAIPAFAGDLATSSENPALSYFAEPRTGRKVLSYTIDLALDRETKRGFEIPGQCAEVLRLFDQGSAYKGRVLDRRFWLKVTNDCRYYQLLRRHPKRAIADHVSDFDFMNARLDILPYSPGCIPIGSEDAELECHPTIVDPFGTRQQFPLIETLRSEPPEGHGQSCVLRDGVFTGRIHADRQGLHCLPDQDAPSLRLVGVDFADINGDGFMDAILRFLPAGPGSIRRMIFLPVTRYSEDGEFQLPTMP